MCDKLEDTTEDYVYQALQKFAKEQGFYKVDLLENSLITYLSEEAYHPSYNLVFLKHDPLECKCEQEISIYPVQFKSQFDAMKVMPLIEQAGLNVYVTARSWQKVKEELETLAANGFTMTVYGASIPLIKPFETFEEAMVRIDLLGDEHD